MKIVSINLNLTFIGMGVLFLVAMCGCAGPRTYTEVSSGNETGFVQITCDAGHKHFGSNHQVVSDSNRRLSIVKLDGKNLTSVIRTMTVGITTSTDRPQGVETARVKPGSHEMIVVWRSGHMFASGSLSFFAESEKFYVICWQDDTTAISFWVEDAASGAKIFDQPIQGIKKAFTEYGTLFDW